MRIDAVTNIHMFAMKEPPTQSLPGCASLVRGMPMASEVVAFLDAARGARVLAMLRRANLLVTGVMSGTCSSFVIPTPAAGGIYVLGSPSSGFELRIVLPAVPELVPSDLDVLTASKCNQLMTQLELEYKHLGYAAIALPTQVNPHWTKCMTMGLKVCLPIASHLCHTA